MIFPPAHLQETMLQTVALLGVFFLLLDAGLTIDFSIAWKKKGSALAIGLADTVIPMLVAFVPFLLLPSRYLPDPGQRALFVLFMATVSCTSALPLAARALHDFNIMKTDMGVLIMSALCVNDIVGWVVFSSVLGIIIHAKIEFLAIFLLLAGIIVFTVIMLTFGRALAGRAISKLVEKEFPEPGSSLTFILLYGVIGGAIAQRLGINAMYGFFIAGIAAGGAKALSGKARAVISQMVHALFIPVFFASMGLYMDFFKNFDLPVILLITSVGIFGRFYGAWVGFSIIDQPRENRLAISIAHTPGGEMSIILGSVALGVGLISPPVFVGIMFAFIISSIAVGPWMNYALERRKKISLLRFFSKRDIIPELKSATRDAAIREICGRAAKYPHAPDEEIIYSSVLETEEATGTAVENGIAIPHARFAAFDKPVIIFARTLQGIDWNSPDDNPTNLIFLVLSEKDDGDTQVQIVSGIMKALGKEGVRKSLLKVRNSNQLWNILRKAFREQQFTVK